MASQMVTIRDLRNHGGDVVERVAGGDRVVITRSGRPVAELRPLTPEPVPLEVLIARRRLLPPVDIEQLRADVDRIVDATV